MTSRGFILVVEDEDGIRAIAADLLRSHRYDVVEAVDDLDAAAIIEARGAEIGHVLRSGRLETRPMAPT